jgi:ankyrin repeat protein
LVLRNGKAESIPILAKTILEFDPDVNIRDGHDRTPLMSASGRGLPEITELLLRRKATINAQDNQKESALYDAVLKRQLEVAKILLNNEANPNIANNIGRTPLHAAAWHGWHEMLELLLLMDNIDVNPKDIRSGYTPLHDACNRNHDTVVRTLLDNGADVNARSSKNWTPLHIAAKNGNAVIVKELLQTGADTMLYTQTLDTPESLVPKNDKNGIVDLLKTKDLAGSGTTRKKGKDLNVTKPSPDQENICRQFEGFIWPSVDKTYRYDALTVWDMLYAKSPKLKKLRGRSAPTWIHLPANVVSNEQ